MIDSPGGHAWFWLTVVVIAGGLLYLLAPVLTPFLVAGLLAYLGDPLADRMEHHGFSRTFAVITVFTVIIVVLLLVLLILVPLLEQQIVNLIGRVPAYLQWLQSEAGPWLQARLGVDVPLFDIGSLRENLTQYMDRIGGLAVNLLAGLSRSSAVLFGWVANLFLIPVLTFYLLRDWDRIIARIAELLPRHVESAVGTLARESDQMLGSFLRGQFLVMLALGIIYSVGLTVVGLEFALLIGMVAGLVSFVPYLGLIVGGLLACVAALFQFQDVSYLVPVLLVFGIGQLVEGMVLTPLLVGDRIGMHPVAVIFALLAGGHLFGFFGILLALPAAAVIMVLLRHVHRQYRGSRYYGVPADSRPATGDSAGSDD